MENMQKALIMAGSVFMFVIAISVAIFSYNTVRDVNDSILTSSERYATTAEYFIEETEDVTRYATKAEVIMAIYSMADNDFVASEIRVDGTSFKAEKLLTTTGIDEIERNIKNKIINSQYSVSYGFNNLSGAVSSGDKIIIYTSVS